MKDSVDEVTKLAMRLHKDAREKEGGPSWDDLDDDGKAEHLCMAEAYFGWNEKDQLKRAYIRSESVH